jgi:hypothetical protein
VSPAPTAVLDPIPIVLLFVLLVAGAMASYEIGYRVGRRRPEGKDEPEGPGGMIVGGILGLVAFMLAISMGLASDRFDTRRGLVLEEATTIETAYLRAGYLPEPFQTEIRDLIREYVPLRIAPTDLNDLPALMARSEEIQDELWALAEQVATEYVDSDLTALVVDSINEIIRVSTYRVTAGVYARVPDTILILLFALTALSIAMVGYRAGVTNRHSLVTATLLAVTLCAVLTLVVDLDRPQEGFLNVSQRALEELQHQIGPPP